LLPLSRFEITSPAFTREIIPFSKVQLTSYIFMRGTILFLEAKHLNCLTSPALLGLKWQQRGQAMRPINRTLVVLLRERYFSLFDIYSLPRQGD